MMRDVFNGICGVGILVLVSVAVLRPSTFRVDDLVVDGTASVGSQFTSPEVDIGYGVLGTPGNGPGLCAPPAPTPQGSGGPYDPYGYVPTGCPGFPIGYSVLDLDLTGGDVTIDGLPQGSPGQILVLINEGGANLYLYNNMYSTEWPFLLPGFHEQWLALTESSIAVLKFGPTRYGENYWQVTTVSDSALMMPRDLAPGSDYRASVSACGSGGTMISSGGYSGAIQTGSDAMSCLLTIHPPNASGFYNCVMSAANGASVANNGWTRIEVGPPITFQTTLSGSGIGGTTINFFCNSVGN